jgi:putative ABC transport system substrate-binding protein
MRRRQALAWIVACLGARSSVALSQNAPRIPVVGLLDAGDVTTWWSVFRQRMQELGYTEGRNVSYQMRQAKGKLDDMPALAKELVNQKVAVIVTASTASAIAAERATKTIPIVMASGGDPVSRGLASSLGSSGSNITGVSSRSADLMGKRIDLLQDVAPKGMRVGVLWQSDNVASMTSVREADASAAKQNVPLQSFGIREVEDLAAAFDAMSRQRITALLVVHGPLVYRERSRVIALAQERKLPAIYGAAEYPDAGGLLSYGPSYPALFREAATYVDRILKGAKPTDLPIGQATVFDLVVNARAARAIGVNLPPSLIARATRVLL